MSSAACELLVEEDARLLFLGATTTTTATMLLRKIRQTTGASESAGVTFVVKA